MSYFFSVEHIKNGVCEDNDKTNSKRTACMSFLFVYPHLCVFSARLFSIKGYLEEKQPLLQHTSLLMLCISLSRTHSSTHTHRFISRSVFLGSL